MSSVIPNQNTISNNPFPSVSYRSINPLLPPNFWRDTVSRHHNRRLLDNKGNKFPSTSKRDKNWLRILQKKMWSLLGKQRFPNKSMRLCGSGLHYNATEISFKLDKKGGAYASGLTTCKNHKCAWCAPVREQQYTQRIKQQLQTAIDNKRMVAFITGTAGFYVKSDYRERMTALSASFGETMRQINKKYPSARMRRIEDTINDKTNQPHYHLHALVDFQTATKEDKQFLEQDFLRRWRHNLSKFECVKKVSSEAQRVIWIENDKGISRYVAKNLAFEVSSRTTKVGKGKDSSSWFEWFEKHNGTTFTDEKRRVAMKMLEADMNTKTITFSKDWITNEEVEEAEERKDNEEFAIVNPHSGLRFMRFSYEGFNSDKLFKLMSEDKKKRERFSAICYLCDEYLVENPFSYHEAGELMECFLRDWVEELNSSYSKLDE